MKLIFSNIEEINEVLPVPLSVDFAALKPSIEPIQNKWLKPLIGNDQFSKIIEWLTGTDVLSNEKNELIRLCRYPLSQIILRESSDIINIMITQGGFQVAKTENTEIASANRVLLFKEQLTMNSQMGFDQLIDFLENNADDFTEYKDSPERKARKKLLIPSAREFNTGLIGIEINHFVFEKIRAVLETYEARFLIKVLGAELYAHIKTKTSNSESLGVYAPLLPLIQKALPGVVLADTITALNLKVDERGVYISIIRNANEAQQTEKSGVSSVIESHRKYSSERFEDLAAHLIENAENYPLFSASQAFTDRGAERIESGKKGVFYGIN
jgi:hypothetical protein